MPNNYARIVRCAHFTCACARDCEIESELRALIQMLFQYPTYNYTNTIKIKFIYFICHIHNYTEYNSLHLTHPSAHTHLEQWAADCAASGEQLGVRGLAQGSHLSRGYFLPEPGFEPTTLSYLGFHDCPITKKFFFVLPHLHPQSLVPFPSVFDRTYGQFFK